MCSVSDRKEYTGFFRYKQCGVVVSCFLDWGPVHSILLRFIYVIAHDTSFDFVESFVLCCVIYHTIMYVTWRMDFC